MIAQTHAAAVLHEDQLVADLRPAVVVVPHPREAAERTAPGSVPADHVELVAAEIVSGATVVSWVVRLVLLVALGVTAWLVLLP
ncbi:MAG: hypothetical protein JOZ82_00475 [Marmoricola sp.]|nr:hypothetical protein [Marmoricola sp.]